MINLKQLIHEIEEEKKGIWHNIHAKKKRGEKPAKKGSKAYKKAEKAIKDLQDGTCECADCGCGNVKESRDPASIRKEYKELKKQSISNLRKEWSRMNKVGNPNSLDKEGLVSDIIRQRHGNKYVDKAFESKVTEADYQGRDVKLNKPTRGDTKKFKVYVNTGKKNKDGSMKIKKVEFGARGSENRIKKSDPERRKSFRARHKCDQKKDKTSAGYWSCKKW